MSEWNAMTYEGKDTILRVVRHEAEQFFALAEPPAVWDSPTACEGWATRDLVAHIVDTTVRSTTCRRSSSSTQAAWC
jgi:hypothetical protein